MRKRFRKMTALLLAVVMVTLMIPITTISVSAGTVIENAISWALGIADDDSHGYSQLQNRRWGNPDYDCSTFVITAFANAGCDVEGATYTGNMVTAQQPPHHPKRKPSANTEGLIIHDS